MIFFISVTRKEMIRPPTVHLIEQVDAIIDKSVSAQNEILKNTLLNLPFSSSFLILHLLFLL